MKIMDKVWCYECSAERGLFLFRCPDGLYVPYCKKCILKESKLHYLRRRISYVTTFPKIKKTNVKEIKKC